MRTLKTPRIPAFIKSFRHPKYRNVFELFPNNRLLYATETLFGCWDATILLMAKDGAPAQVIEGLAKQEGNGAWRHAERERGDCGGYLTNETLCKLVSKHLNSRRLLYGSAAAHMLSKNPKWSRRLPEMHGGELSRHLCSTLDWTISKMKELKVIACLGEDAWRLVCVTLKHAHLATEWKKYRDREEPLLCRHEGRRLTVTAHYHPGARVSAERKELGWKILSKQ